MQTLLLTMIFIGIYGVVKVIVMEYTDDKNMHEQRVYKKDARARCPMPEILEGRDARGRQRYDSGLIAERPHANCGPSTGRGCGKKRDMYVQQKYDLYTPTSIYAYPRFHLTHFAPPCQKFKISFKQNFLCRKSIYKIRYC